MTTIKTTDDARTFLTTWMRANFPTDRTYDRYIAERLAGDFAWQLANALATQAAPTQAAPQTLEDRLKIIRDFGNAELTRLAETGQVPIHTALAKIEAAAPRVSEQDERVLPCPFCQSVDVRVFSAPDEHGRASFGVQCSGSACAICGPERDSKDEAITAWNRRVSLTHSAQAAPRECDEIGHAFEVYSADGKQRCVYCKEEWMGAQAAQGSGVQADAVTAIVRDVCELDYTGENWDHESMLSVTLADLRLICERHIAASPAPSAAPVQSFEEWWNTPHPVHGHPPKDTIDPYSARNAWDAAKGTAPAQVAQTDDEQRDPLQVAGTALLEAGRDFWDAAKQSGQYGAVQWVEGEDGALALYTRGEYRETLLANIPSFEPPRRFDSEAAQVAQGEPVADGWIALASIRGEPTSVAFADETTARAVCIEGEPLAFRLLGDIGGKK